MARLPQPGGDSGNWGIILNDFLSQAHSTNGALKDNVVTAATIQDGTITENQLDTATQNKLNTAGSGSVADGTITTAKLHDDAVTDVKVSPSAAIAQSKIANLTSDLAGKAAVSHTHTASQISDSTATGRSVLMAADAAAARTAIGAGTSNLAIGTTGSTAKAGDYQPAWSDVTSKPTTFTPSAHSHAISDTTGLQTALDAKSPLASPTFTGLVTTPTIKITGGSPGAGKVLTSDADGDASWQDASAGSDTMAGAIFNVKDYGATGDGTTNDVAAIQSAIAASTNYSTIFFPPGIYIINTPIVYRGDRTYAGAGGGLGGTSAIRFGASINPTGMSGVTGVFVPNCWSTNSTSGDSPVVFTGLNISGNKQNNTTGALCGIILQNFWSRIENCYIHDTNLDSIRVTDVTDNGTALTSAIGSENRILNNHLVNADGCAIRQIYAGSTGSNFDGYVEGNTIQDVLGTGAIVFDNATGWSIHRNHTYGVRGHGIYAPSAYAVAITDNYLEDFGKANVASTNYYGIYALAYAGRGYTISNNNIACTEPSANTSSYFYIYVGGSPASGSSTSATVIGNQMRGETPTAQGYGIRVSSQTTGGTLYAHLAGNNTVNVNSGVTTFGTGTIVFGQGGSSTTGQTLIKQVASATADLIQVQNSAGANIFRVDYAGRRRVGTGSVATIAAGAQAGTGATVAISGDDSAGRITVTTGTGAAAGQLASITFSTVFANSPHVVVTAGDTSSAAAQLFVTTSTSAFSLRCAGTPPSSTVLTIYYSVIGA